MPEQRQDALVRLTFASPMAAYLGVRDLRSAGMAAELSSTDDGGRTAVVVRCQHAIVEQVVAVAARYPGTRVDVR